MVTNNNSHQIIIIRQLLGKIFLQTNIKYWTNVSEEHSKYSFIIKQLFCQTKFNENISAAYPFYPILFKANHIQQGSIYFRSVFLFPE